MFEKLNALLAPAVMERLTLAFNHVIAAEPEAVARLLPHQGRLLRVSLVDWPRLLPPPPVLAFRVTPAGLLEWSPDAIEADLQLRVQAGQPAALMLRMLGGELPAVAIEGDAQFASAVDWLIKHLRWDAAADLEKLIGPGAAHEVVRVGGWLLKGVRSAVEGFVAMAGRMRPPAPPP